LVGVRNEIEIGYWLVVRFVDHGECVCVSVYENENGGDLEGDESRKEQRESKPTKQTTNVSLFVAINLSFGEFFFLNK
jgi:hypothetical protein